MRSLGERVNLLRRLAKIKYGPGAAILPSEVTRIHMDFAMTGSKGHVGPMKFWRECLPRLKYYNPSVPMVVNRRDTNEIPPRMTVYLRNIDFTPTDSAAAPTPTVQPSSSRINLSPPQPPTPEERAVHIDMKDKHSSHILEWFLAETRAVPIQPAKEDIVEMQEVEALQKQAELDRARVAARRAEQKREEDMLKRARALGGLADSTTA